MPRTCSPAPRTFNQIILAGGDDDISPADLVDWVYPVLCGIPAGRWLTCEIASANRGSLTARMRSGWRVPHLALCCTIPHKHAQPLRRLIPEAPPLLVILLDDHAAQVMTLLDGMARWLNVFEAADPALAPIVSLLNTYRGEPLTAADESRAVR